MVAKELKNNKENKSKTSIKKHNKLKDEKVDNNSPEAIETEVKTLKSPPKEKKPSKPKTLKKKTLETVKKVIKEPKTNEKVFIDPDSLYRHVEFLTKIKPARAFNNTKALQKAEEYIESEFKKMGLKTEKQIFKASEKPRARKREYCNIIGTINPGKSEIIVIGAHYDVCTGESKVNPGADDNASGVAGLIELARILNKNKKKIPYQIQFIAYANEEPPFFDTEFMGSYVHAKSLFDSKANVKFMLVLEMIGYYSDKENSQDYPPIPLINNFYPSVGNFIMVVSNFVSSFINNDIKNAINKHSKIKSYTMAHPGFVRNLGLSDHRNYWHFGFKAVMLTDTAFYRNPHYHQKTDKIDTIDFKKMSEVVKGIAYYFLNLS